MRRHSLFLTIAAVLAVAACSPRAARKSAKDAKDAEKAAGLAGADYTPGVDVTEASLRGSDFATVEGLKTIQFDYDSSSLSPSVLETLKANAAYLKKQSSVEILVAGHCDQRGTVEYNLALGQRRAKEVREYYIRLGVPGKSIATISYGKETPSCGDFNESCWSENRRAETRLRAATASNGKHDKTAQ